MKRKLCKLVILTILFGFNASLVTAQSHKAVIMVSERYRPSLNPGDTVVIQCRPAFTGDADRGGEPSQAKRLASAEENNILLLCLAIGNSEEYIKTFKTNVEVIAGVLDLKTGSRNTGSTYIWNTLIGLGYASYNKPYINTSATKFFADLASKKLRPDEIGVEPIILQMTVEVVSYEEDPAIPILTFKDPTSNYKRRQLMPSGSITKNGGTGVVDTGD